MSDEREKNIDEAWKEAVEKETEKAARGDSDTVVPPEADFSFFITTLALQASISLGVVANPATNKTDENLPQARFLIDTLGMLKEKTKENLTEAELRLLENVLYELRLQYVSKIKDGEK